MEQIHEWQREMHAKLEHIAQQLRELSNGPTLPTLSSPILEPNVQKMEDGLLVIFQKIERGIRKLVDLVLDLTSTKKEATSTLLQAMSDMVTIASVVIKDVKPSLNILATGESVQDLLGISEKTMESLYHFTCYLYENQHYEEASGAFCLLSLLNPAYKAFWLGLGNCEYFLRRYQEALLAYTFAFEIMPSDPVPQLLMTKCHIGLGNYMAAKATLSMVEISSDPKALEKCKKQVESLKADVRRALP